jgi:hypothetical protein
MSVILFSEYNFNNLQLLPPTKNRLQQTGLSSRNADPSNIQFGSAEKPCCIVEEVFKAGQRYVVRLSLTTEFVQWYGRLEATIVDRVTDQCSSWFKYNYDRPTVQRMLHSLLQHRCEIVVLCSSAVKCYLQGEDEELKRIDVAELSPGSIVVPIVHFEGIFIGEKHFTPSFTVSDFLVVGKEEKQENHPFLIKPPVENEIIDPFSYYSRNNADTHSAGSFDTHVFTA